MTRIKYFITAVELINLINGYFASVGMNGNAAPGCRKRQGIKRRKTQKLKPSIHPTGANSSGIKYDPPTLSGLALFLGFDSLEELETYEMRGKYAAHVRRARLLIIATYEKRLHNTYSSGAIFALKGMGWPDKSEDKKNATTPTTLQVNMTISGPPPASCEKEVVL